MRRKRRQRKRRFVHREPSEFFGLVSGAIHGNPEPLCDYLELRASLREPLSSTDLDHLVWLIRKKCLPKGRPRGSATQDAVGLTRIGLKAWRWKHPRQRAPRKELIDKAVELVGGDADAGKVGAALDHKGRRVRAFRGWDEAYVEEIGHKMVDFALSI